MKTMPLDNISPDAEVNPRDAVISTAAVAVLTSADDPPKRLTKLLVRNVAGGIEAVQYDKGAFLYTVKTHPLPDTLRSLWGLFQELDEHQHIVLGGVAPGSDGEVRR